MQEVFCSHAKIRVSVRVVANRIRSWAELAPRLKAAAKRGDQKVLAARYDLTSDQISRYLSAVMSPDPVVANEIVRDLLGMSLSEVIEERTTPSLTIGGDDFVSVPLVAANVAAGHGAIPELPEDRRVYAFRRDYVRRAIGTGDPRDGTLVTVFLARNKSLGSSMLPTIQPGSLILVDRRPVERIKDRGIYLIEYPDLAEEHGLAVKRLTLEKRKAILVAESDNPEPRYYPRIIDLDGVRISDIVKGRVILWSTEADEA